MVEERGYIVDVRESTVGGFCKDSYWTEPGREKREMGAPGTVNEEEEREGRGGQEDLESKPSKWLRYVRIIKSWGKGS